MPKQYSVERKFKVATLATKMKKDGVQISEMSQLFDIPQKTIEKWILHLRTGKLKPVVKKEIKKINIDLSVIESELSKLSKKIDRVQNQLNQSGLVDMVSTLESTLKQTNIRFDALYQQIAEEKEIKALAEKICNKD